MQKRGKVMCTQFVPFTYWHINRTSSISKVSSVVPQGSVLVVRHIYIRDKYTSNCLVRPLSVWYVHNSGRESQRK